MKKNLRIVSAVAAVMVTSAVLGQGTVPGRSLKPASVSESRLSIPKTRTASCGPDYVDYGWLKEDTVGTGTFYTVGLPGGDLASASYLLNQAATVNGVYFIGFPGENSNPAMSVTVSLFNASATFQPTGTALATAVVPVSASGFTQVNFATPVSVVGNFAVSVTPIAATDTLDLYINDPFATTYDEGRSHYRYQGTWYGAAAAYGMDLEHMVAPIVSYNVTSSFATANDSICAGAPATFTNQSSSLFGNRMFNLHAFDTRWLGEVDSTFKWTFGDGSPAVYGQNGSHTYTTAGTYTVQLIGRMKGHVSECADTMTMTMTVLEAPVATVTPAGATTFCEGGSVALDAAPVSGSTYQWMMDGNPIGGSTFAQHIANQSGSYEVTITNMCGTNTSSPIVVEEIMNPVATAAAAGSTTSCDGSMVTLDATPVSGATYQWLMDGNAIGGSTFAQHMANESGNYAVVVANQCDSDTSSGIAVLVLAPASISASSTTVCQGEQAVLTASPDNNSSYQWYMDDIVMATETNPTYTAILSGEFKVEVSNACGTTMDSTMVTVNPTPTTPMISQDATTSYLLVDSASVDTSSMIQWFHEGAAISGANNYSHFPDVIGYYHVMVTDSNGCMVTSDSVNVMTVDVKELASNSIFVSPNPTEGVFTVNYSSTATGTVTVTLVNVRGQVIMSEQIGQFSGKVTRTYDISGNDAGVYFLHVASEKGATVHKVVVSK